LLSLSCIRSSSNSKIDNNFGRLIAEEALVFEERIQQEALRQIEIKGAKGSRNKWWAFEGFTSIDCRLKTEKALIFIEGKRTDLLSPSTEWYPHRNQLFRILETCKEAASHKIPVVLVAAEEPPDLPILNS